MSNEHLKTLSAAQMRQVAGGWGFGPPPAPNPFITPPPPWYRPPQPPGVPWPLPFPVPCPIPRPWKSFGGF